MAKCPNCGSTAQVKLVGTEYHEDGWSIQADHYCVCGCGQAFIAKAWFKSEGYDEIEPIPKVTVQRKFCGRG